MRGWVGIITLLMANSLIVPHLNVHTKPRTKRNITNKGHTSTNRNFNFKVVLPTWLGKNTHAKICDWFQITGNNDLSVMINDLKSEAVKSEDACFHDWFLPLGWRVSWKNQMKTLRYVCRIAQQLATFIMCLWWLPNPSKHSNRPKSDAWTTKSKTHGIPNCASPDRRSAIKIVDLHNHAYLLVCVYAILNNT